MDLPSRLLQMATGAWLTRMIHVAAACGADGDSVFRLLRGPASVGVFQETAPRTFALTPLAELMRSDHPESLRQFLRMLGEEHCLAWDGLLQSVRSGAPSFRRRCRGVLDDGG